MMEYLFIVSFICVLIIIAIIVLQFVLLNQSRQQLFKQQQDLNEQKSQMMKMSDDMEMLMTKISQGIHYKVNSSAISILDLAEFQELDPFLKEQYKRHILYVLVPAIMQGINKTAKANMLEEYLIENDKEISDAIYNLAREIKEKGFTFPPPTSSDLPKPSPYYFNQPPLLFQDPFATQQEFS